jgi:dinuclear metal center YbgI/SA1388 family protein
MTITLLDIEQHLEALAPKALAEPWDNCGWQVFAGNKEVKKILTVLSVSQEVMKKAYENNIDLIISHHPVIFEGVKAITPETLTGDILLKSISGNIAIYSMHTNLDKIPYGVSDILARGLKLENIQPLIPDPAGPAFGLGRIGHLAVPEELPKVLKMIKDLLSIESIKVINQKNIQKVKTIALCGGSGASLMSSLPAGVDLYLTGDIKYHDAIEALEYVLVDANHYHTELLILDILTEYLRKLDIDVESFKDRNPWQMY